MRWTSHVARMGRENGAYRVSVGKAEGKGLCEKPTWRREDNIKVDFQDVGVNRCYLAEDGDRCQAVVNWVMNLCVP